MPENEWKRMVKNAVSEANSKEIKGEITEKYKKLKKSELSKEEFGRKEYIKCLTLQQSRTMFKHRCAMTQHVKMNQMSNPAYAADLWKCEECGQQDTNTHVLLCVGYESLRDGKNLASNAELCDYLHKIFLKRNENFMI